MGGTPVPLSRNRELQMKLVRHSILILIAVLGLLLAAESTLAQCAMCRASIGANSSFIRNFNIGVLVLLVPPVSIFCTIFIVAFRHRKSE
jgi:uncharacterized membrane protein